MLPTNYEILKYILVFIYIYLIAWLFICNPRFHAALSSDREKKIFEKLKKYSQARRVFMLRFV